MGRVCLGMILSVDGYISDRDGKLGKLYESFEPNEVIQAEMAKTGAVVMGRNTFDMSEDPDAYADDYEFQVPLFILTHHPPANHPKENENLTITFVTDGIESAVHQAKQAAKEKDVVVLGADVGQQLLKANLADDLQVAFAPIILGQGVRLFDHLEELEIRLEKLRTIETAKQVEIWYRVMKEKKTTAEQVPLNSRVPVFNYCFPINLEKNNRKTKHIIPKRITPHCKE